MKVKGVGMLKFIQFLAIGFVALLGFSGQASAGITEVQALRFGEYIVKNNDAVYTITVNIGGVVTFDPAGFFEIAATGQDGIYDLDGMPPNMAIASVVITQITPLAGPSGPNFQMNTFQESHPATTDGSGVARIGVGANADTTGSGVPYVDQTYTGTLQIQINF